jgi:steroid delta-isomerase-like uncharacterized protein
MEAKLVEEKLSTDIRAFTQEYFDAWTEGVLEKILSYYSDDVVINLLSVPALLEGKEAVTKNFVLPFINGFPGNVHRILNLIHQGNQVVVEWMFVATHKGNFAGIPPTGRTVNLPGCSVYTLEGRQFTRGHLYYNGPTLLEQLGGTR